ncbi:MAG: hypothetical protein AABW88_05155, partial [Nanoarchaeota archaeon]
RLKTFGGWLTRMIAKNDEQKISRSLLETYVNRANSTLDSQPGTGVSVNRLTIIYGMSGVDIPESDSIIPIADANAIYAAITSGDKNIFQTPVFHNLQKDARDVKTKIKERLNE